jgi:hypothetical protein
MLYVLLLVLIGALAYVRAHRKAREASRTAHLMYGYRTRRERSDCWFV